MLLFWFTLHKKGYQKALVCIRGFKDWAFGGPGGRAWLSGAGTLPLWKLGFEEILRKPLPSQQPCCGSFQKAERRLLMGRLLTASGQGWPRGRAGVGFRNPFPSFAGAGAVPVPTSAVLSRGCTSEAPGDLVKDPLPPPDDSDLMSLGRAQALVSVFLQDPWVVLTGCQIGAVGSKKTALEKNLEV